MRTQLLSGSGKSVLSSLFLCFLVTVVPDATAQGPAPSLGGAGCTVQVVKMGAACWQIKGTGSLIDIPVGVATAKLTVTFQKKPKGGAWADLFTATQSMGVVIRVANGPLPIDTGFQVLTPAPAQGDQYRVTISGTSTSGNQQVVTNLGTVQSNPYIPVP